MSVHGEQQAKEENMTSECDHDELGADSYSCSSCKTALSNGSSGNTVRSNEVIPASVSSSENSNSAVINPMVVYANQTTEGKQGGAQASRIKEDFSSQKMKKDGHGTVIEERISIDDYPPNLVTREESSQNEKLNSGGPKEENALSDEESAMDFTSSSQLSGPIQKPSMCATVLQGNTSEQIRFKEKEQKTAPLEDEVTSRQSLSQKLSTSHLAESLPFDPSEKILFIASDQSSQFKEDDMKDEARVAKQVDIDDDTQGQRNNFRPLKRHLKNSPEGKKSGDTVNEKQVRNKCPSPAAEGSAKTSKSLSEETHNSNSNPIQSSLEVDALTPCLFENDSWETPDKKVSQKRAKSSFTRREEIINENKFSSNEVDFETIRALGESEATTAHLLFSGVVESSVGIRKQTTSDTDLEGTQSFGTSQSISVLHDLEFPSQEQQDDPICNEELSSRCGKSFNTESKSDNTWVEPLPKKPKTGHQTESQRLDPNMSSEYRNCPNSDKPHSSECMESDVIPPTPPVKPVTKQEFGNPTQSSFKLSRSRMKLQREKDEENCHSKRLAVKQKKRIKSPHCSKSPRLQDDKLDGDGTHCSSVGSEISEASVSFLADHPTCSRSPRTVIDESNSQAMEPEYDFNLSLKSKRLKSSRDRNTETAVNKSDINPNKSPKGLTRFSKSQKQRNLVENISPQDLDEPCLPQSKSNSQVSQNESQIGRHPEDRRREDLKGSPVAEEVESVHSLTCSPVKQRVDGDSFDWSGTRGTRKGSANSQNSVITFGNDDDEKEHLTERENEDCSDNLLNFPRASQARHEVEGSREDCSKKNRAETPQKPFLVDDGNGDSLNVGDDKDFYFTDGGEGDSSDDEALLKPVFLPKESAKSRENKLNCNEDAHDNDEEEEAAIFSQELIPSENNDEDDDEITSPSKALDSTGASSATFLSEATASSQKMEVLRQDVEAMEKEMEELRAYLAKTDENRDEEENTIENGDMDSQEADVVDAEILPSLTPPPPLTPKSIPPMRQLSTPLKDVSRYLDQEGQSTDEGSECEEIISNEPVKRSELRKSSRYQGDKSDADKNDSKEKSAKKRPLSTSYEDDGLSITAVEQRQETPSPPSRGDCLVQTSQEKDEDKLIVVDDRDGPDSRTGSLLLVKRRKVTQDLVPKKSPVVSLVFTRAVKDAEKTSQSPRPVAQLKESSHATRNSSPFIYSRKRGLIISPIRGQNPPRAVLRDGVSRETVSREIVTGENTSRDNLSRERTSNEICSRDSVPCSSAPRERVSPGKVSRDSVSHNSVSREKMLHDRCHSPDVVLTKVKDATNKKDDNDIENKTTARQLSFVATRLNRQQLAEARALAETYGGKLASEFNTKTSHVIMTTDENMQVTRHSYTMKYLLGLALGKWIVSHRWIAACKQAKTLVPEADYEVKGDSGLGQISIPRAARTARNNKEALLFEDFDVLCFGGFSAAVSKEQLSQLLKFCGARVFIDAESLKRTEKARQKVVIIDKETRDNLTGIKAICRHLNTKPVSLEWVTDSIANYKIQESKDYIVEL